AHKLGIVLLNRGRIADAVAELKRANALEPDTPETLLDLGKATATAGDLAAAEKLLLRALEQTSASSLAESAHYPLSQIYRKLGRPADADRETKLFQDLRRARR